MRINDLQMWFSMGINGLMKIDSDLLAVMGKLDNQ